MDTERAVRDQFGGTIADGCLTLPLGPATRGATAGESIDLTCAG